MQKRSLGFFSFKEHKIDLELTFKKIIKLIDWRPLFLKEDDVTFKIKKSTFSVCTLSRVYSTLSPFEAHS